MKEEVTPTPEEEEPCCSEEAAVEGGVEVEEVEETEEEEVEAEEEAEAEVEIEEEAEAEEEVEAETPTVPVTFSWCPPTPEKVFIAGTFNDWNPSSHQLTRSETGEWQITLDLAPGTYEYRLIIDGEWITDPRCEDKAPNSFGSYNSVLRVE